jgi:metal-responsive CopG/Arc/MetJ family transcriptional regulator
MERINVRVEGRLKKRLEAAAEDRGVSPSEIVRQALDEYLRRATPQETCFDLAQRLGILGSAKGLPPDLSTNPDHMEGFGRD